MSTLKKIIIVAVCGGIVWGLSYCGSVWTAYALVTSSFAAGVTALCGIITGYPPTNK